MNTYSEIHAAIVAAAGSHGWSASDAAKVADSAVAHLAILSDLPSKLAELPLNAIDSVGDQWTSAGEDVWEYIGPTGRSTVVSTAELHRLYGPIEYR